MNVTYCRKLELPFFIPSTFTLHFTFMIGSQFDDEKSLIMSQMSLEKRFGQSSVFVASTLMEYGGVPQSATPESLLKEAIHVISCGYEDKTDWGSEVMTPKLLKLQLITSALLMLVLLLATSMYKEILRYELMFCCLVDAYNL